MATNGTPTGHVVEPADRRVVVVDHIRAHRDGLCSAVELEPGLSLVAGVESMSDLGGEDRIDAVILQVPAPGIDIEREVARARQRAPHALIAVLAVYADDRTTTVLTRHGADAVRSTDTPLDELFALLRLDRRSVRDADPVADASARRVAMAAARHHITARELDVLRRLSDGTSPQAIAHELDRSVDTVREHLGALRRKLGCTSAVELVVTAHRLGLLPNVARPVR